MNWGVWLEYEIDVKGIFYVCIDWICKLLIMELVWVFGFGFDDEIWDMLGSELEFLNVIIEKDLYKELEDFWVEEFLKDIYEWFCLGELKMVDFVWFFLMICFFDLKCYDMVLVGCYKINKKL